MTVPPDNSSENMDLSHGSGEMNTPIDALVEAIRHPFLVLNPDLSIAKANSVFFEKFRVSPEDVRGRPIFKLGEGWDIPKLRALLEETIQQDSAFDDFELEYDVPGLGTKILRLSGRPTPPIDGPVPKIVLTIEDITEKKRLQRELRDSEIRYRRLFESAEDGILLLNFESGRIEDANPYLARILGYSRNDLHGKELWELGLFENAATFRSAFRKLQETGYIRFEDQPLRTLSGRSIEVEFICAVYQVGTRNTIQCNIRDVSDRKSAEAAHFKSEEKLRQSQKMEALGKLAGGIAHDFNNLLTAINGYSDLCLSMSEGEGPLHDNLVEIQRAGERAAGLTRQILAYSRQQMLAPKPIRLNDLVGDMKKMLERIIGDHILVELVLDPGLGIIKADPSQIEQVILNLAVNARDAMQSGGTLTLETRMVGADDNAPLEPDLKPSGPYAMLAVRDTGIGMDPAMIPHIFDPFYTTKGLGKGTGLGLSVVHGIVTQSGGSIQVESEPGQGSTFKIFLPMREDASIEPDRSKAGAVARGAETVLLVEDEEVVRRFCHRILETQGYTILEAPDGKTALSLAEKFEGTIHLLLTDMVMPGMSGQTLAERFLLDHPDSPVLFMSGYTPDHVSPHGLLENRTGFLHKPFTAQALTEAVRKSLDMALPVR